MLQAEQSLIETFQSAKCKYLMNQCLRKLVSYTSWITLAPMYAGKTEIQTKITTTCECRIMPKFTLFKEEKLNYSAHISLLYHKLNRHSIFYLYPNLYIAMHVFTYIGVIIQYSYLWYHILYD